MDGPQPRARFDDRTLDVLFRETRTMNAWFDKPVTDDQIRQIYDLVKWGPTTSNSSPSRFFFLRTQKEKERLRPALSANNTNKTMTAPVVTIIAYDLEFWQNLPRLYVANAAARTWFEGKDPAFIEETCLRNGSMQAAYLLMATRSLGLDAAAMSGFDNKKVDAEFFPDGRFKTNMLCCIGYGNPANNHPRSPRLTFEEACKFL
jgi:3-hydroxypropanoate dehydrogenase